MFLSERFIPSTQMNAQIPLLRVGLSTGEERLECIAKIEAKKVAIARLGVFKNPSEVQGTHLTIAFSN